MIKLVCDLCDKEEDSFVHVVEKTSMREEEIRTKVTNPKKQAEIPTIFEITMRLDSAAGIRQICLTCFCAETRKALDKLEKSYA